MEPLVLPIWPAFDHDFEEAINAVLKSGKVNYWTGPHGRAFEESYAKLLGVQHAIAVANGTVALEMPLEAWGIGPGDEVVVTPRTFIASASAIIRVGATPIFADVDRESGNITAASVEKVLTKRTKGIVGVHLAGWPLEMDEFNELCRAKNLRFLEDCAQSHGALYRGRHTGSLGDAAAFSFCQDKIITTLGEGGLVTTRDEDLWAKMWALKDHGKDFDVVFNKAHPPGFRWLHESFGTNYRMTEVQSAAGRLALTKLDTWIARRREIASRYQTNLKEANALRIPSAPEHLFHSYYRFYAYVRPEKLRTDFNRDRIMAEINELGAPCLSGTCSEIYLEAAFRKLSLGPAERLPIARELGETSLQLPMHPLLTNEQVDAICERWLTVLARATQ